MLGPGRYLLGIVEIALLVGFAWLGGSVLRARLLPKLSGTPAQLSTAVLALALLIWVAELLGTVGAFEPVPYLAGIVVVGLGIAALSRGAWRRGGVASLALRSAQDKGMGSVSGPKARPSQTPRGGTPPHPDATRGWGVDWLTLVAFVIAAAAVVHFASGVRLRLSTGMTGFDSTWYHGPFAAGFFQSGNTMDLHFIAPQFLAWFYPANGEIFHSVGMLAFGRDLLSPLLNLGWFVGCLVACWCIGRPYRVAPWSLTLGAIALSVPALADQAGEARNDIVGIFFLLAAVAIALNAWAAREGERGLSTGALAVVGLAAGLAAGTKLNFLLPAGVLVVGLGAIAPRGGRWKGLAAAGLAALAGGGYWYLRNLVHSGNPLPWVHHLGPISLPAPEQALGGREAHSVLGYLGDGTVWSDWFLPGLHGGLWLIWPVLGAAVFAGLILCLVPFPLRGSKSTHAVAKEPRTGRRLSEPMLALAGMVGLATALAWLVAPTSASGPEGMPRAFESGLRYLAPALVLGLALLPAAPLPRDLLTRFGVRQSFGSHSATKDCRTPAGRPAGGLIAALAAIALLFAVVIGYPVQRHYLQSRYSDPTFTTPGLNAAFAWAEGVSDAHIATTSTRQYPLFGTDLSNHVDFIGIERPHGGFEAPTTCRTWREELNKGHYDYAVTTYDRLEPGQPPYPPQARWTESTQAKPILRKPPTVVFQLNGQLDPSTCP
ncbi:MAG: hypothetical protein JWM24_240 [Solirubrobacterales bacterium]|nr:hypothetical protein [Solirubrobacterales bacterium]